jgi:phage head-tail adaptor, putative, SPP1 family
MEIGKLRYRVQIQSYTETQDNTHRTFKKWETVLTVWADIQPVKGLVTLDTKQIGEGVTHNFTMRYHPYITTERWLYFDSRRFRIRAVRNLQERSRFLELLCEEDSVALNPFETDTDSVESPLSDLLG